MCIKVSPTVPHRLRIINRCFSSYNETRIRKHPEHYGAVYKAVASSCTMQYGRHKGGYAEPPLQKFEYNLLGCRSSQILFGAYAYVPHRCRYREDPLALFPSRLCRRKLLPQLKAHSLRQRGVRRRMLDVCDKVQ